MMLFATQPSLKMKIFIWSLATILTTGRVESRPSKQLFFKLSSVDTVKNIYFCK